MIEQRRHARCSVRRELTFSLKGSEARSPGISTDISVGGMFIETAAPCAFGSEVVVKIALPGHANELTLPGVVRWSHPAGMGVQFGLLGARETYAITELAARAARENE